MTLGTNSPAPPEDDLGEARNLGRLEAEAFDRRLREAEARDREVRLARLAASTDREEEASWSGGGDGSPYEVWQLRRDVERLAGFHQAVLHSRAWRLLQALRRPFGRAW